MSFFSDQKPDINTPQEAAQIFLGGLGDPRTPIPDALLRYDAGKTIHDVLKSIWDHYIGENPKLNRFVYRRMGVYYDWPLLLFPVIEASNFDQYGLVMKGDSVQLVTWDYSDGVAMDVSGFAPYSVMEITKKGMERQLTAKGKSIRFPIDWWRYSERRNEVVGKMDACSQSFTNGWAACMADAIVTDAVRRHDSEISDACPLPIEEYREYILQRDERTFALQKHGEGFPGLLNWAMQIFRKRGVKLTNCNIVISNGCYHQLTHTLPSLPQPEKKTGAKDDGPLMRTLDDIRVGFTDKDRIPIFESTPLVTEHKKVIDATIAYPERGQYVPFSGQTKMSAQHAEHYVSAHRAVSFKDIREMRSKTIQLIDVIKNSGCWVPGTGEWTANGAQIHAGIICYDHEQGIFQNPLSIPFIRDAYGLKRTSSVYIDRQDKDGSWQDASFGDEASPAFKKICDSTNALLQRTYSMEEVYDISQCPLLNLNFMYMAAGIDGAAAHKLRFVHPRDYEELKKAGKYYDSADMDIDMDYSGGGGGGGGGLDRKRPVDDAMGLTREESVKDLQFPELNNKTLNARSVKNKTPIMVRLPIEYGDETTERLLPLPVLDSANETGKVEQQLQFQSVGGHQLQTFHAIINALERLASGLATRHGDLAAAREWFAEQCNKYANDNVYNLFQRFWNGGSFGLNVYHILRMFQQYVYYRIARFANAQVKNAAPYINALKVFIRIMSNDPTLLVPGKQFDKLQDSLGQFYKLAYAKHATHTGASAFQGLAGVPSTYIDEKARFLIPGFAGEDIGSILKKTPQEIATGVREAHNKQAGFHLASFKKVYGGASGAGSSFPENVKRMISPARRSAIQASDPLDEKQKNYLSEFLDEYAKVLSSAEGIAYSNQDTSKGVQEFVEYAFVDPSFLDANMAQFPLPLNASKTVSILNAILVAKRGKSSPDDVKSFSRKRKSKAAGLDESEDDFPALGKTVYRSEEQVLEDLKKIRPELAVYIWLDKHDIPIPVDALVFRPFVQSKTGSMLVFEAGAETAVTGVAAASVTIASASQGREIQMNYHAESVHFVSRPENIAVIPSIRSYGDIKCGDMKWFTTSPADLSSVVDGTMTKSLYGVLIAYGSEVSNIIDITGEFNNLACRAADKKGVGHYCTSQFYRVLNNWSHPAINPLFLQNDMFGYRGINTTVSLASHTKTVPSMYGKRGDMMLQTDPGVDCFGPMMNSDASVKPLHDLGHYDQMTGAVPRQALLGPNQ
jgi:hypothetical protein